MTVSGGKVIHMVRTAIVPNVTVLHRYSIAEKSPKSTEKVQVSQGGAG